MTTVFKGTSGASQNRVYLEDDRVEVGVMGIAYVEDLSRVAYRDVVAVTFTPTFHGMRRVGGIFMIAVGVIVFVIVAVAGTVGAATVSGGAIAAVGALALWLGRKGTQVRFRVDGIRTHVTGCVGGSRSKQERFKDQLLIRVRAARGRAGGPPSPAPL